MSRWVYIEFVLDFLGKAGNNWELADTTGLIEKYSLTCFVYVSIILYYIIL